MCKDEKNPETVEEPAEAAGGSGGAEIASQNEDTAAADGNNELETIKQELQKQNDLLLRTAAEYDNYRKRTEREKTGLFSDGMSAAAAAFLPVADNLERAVSAQGSEEDFRKGVEMVCTQLKEALTKLGIEEIGVAGEAFNPELHNAVMHVEDEEAGENTITEVFQKGYRIGDKIIRHAMVKVAN